MQSATCNLTKPNFSLSPWSLNVNNERGVAPRWSDIKFTSGYSEIMTVKTSDGTRKEGYKGHGEGSSKRTSEKTNARGKREKNSPQTKVNFEACVFTMSSFYICFLFCFVFSVPLVVLFFFWLASWHAHSICL